MCERQIKNSVGCVKMPKYPKYCPVKLNGIPVLAYPDSGNSAGTCISAAFAEEKLGIDLDKLSSKDVNYVGTAHKNATLQILGRAPPMDLQLGGAPKLFKIRPLIVKDLNMALNLSGPFMKQHRIDQLHSEGCLKVLGKKIALVNDDSHLIKTHVCAISKTHKEKTPIVVPIVECKPVACYTNLKKQIIPPKQTTTVSCRIPEVENKKKFVLNGLVEVDVENLHKRGVNCSASALVDIKDGGVFDITIKNCSDKPVVIEGNLKVGQIFLNTDQVFLVTSRIKKVYHSNSSVASINVIKKKPLSKNEKRQWIWKHFQIDKADAFGPRDKDALVELLLRYWDTISHDEKYGKTHVVVHAIETGNVAPIRQKARPLNPNIEIELKKQIAKWLKQKVIQPSNSPWASPLVAVPKKNGEIRFCVDYRALNNVTKKDAYPIPNIKDNLSRLSGSRIFSAVDGAGAFHAVPIKKDDREKTAFYANNQLWEFNYMPFGLANGPSTYSRLVQKVLQHIPPEEALAYLDDTCVHSKNVSHHLNIIEKMLVAFRKAGLTIKPEKTHFGRSQITYLGHTISKKGISIPNEYTKIIQDWPVPKTMQEIRIFLGKVGYYRRFIKDFSRLALPLSAYITKENEKSLNAHLPLSKDAENAFKLLKNKLISSPILAFPQFQSKNPFIVDTDFSCEPGAIGGVLSQIQDGQEKVIAYGAKKLLAREKNYSSNKGELLAIIFFLNQWKYYLMGRPFVLRTDHEAMKWIRTMHEPRGMVLRWLEMLSNYQFSIEFRKGKKHRNADALSRITHADNPSTQEAKLLCGDEKVLAISCSKEKLKLKQQADEELNQVCKWVEENKKPKGQVFKLLSPELKSYANIFEQLFINDEGILCRFPFDPDKYRHPRICLPYDEINHVVKVAHEAGGHMGIEITAHRIAQRFYFPNLANHCNRIIQACITCQKKNKFQKVQRHSYEHDMVGGPWEKISIDLVGPLKPDKKGNKYIFTVKDCFTRYLEAFPCADITTQTVTQLLYENIFLRYGPPLQCHSDQGLQFTSKQMEEICSELGVAKTKTPAYNPKSNPVERAHRDLGNVLRSLMVETQKEWSELLQNAVMALNSSKSSVTGVTPHFALFGKERRMPIDMIYGPPPESKETMTSHLQNLTEITRQTHIFMRKQQNLAIKRSELQYNHSNKNPIFLDDLVWLFTPILQKDKGRKFSTYWTGPWRVIRKISNVLFEIRTEGDWNDKPVTLIVSHDRIKPYKEMIIISKTQMHLTKDDFNVEDEHGDLYQLPHHSTDMSHSDLETQEFRPFFKDRDNTLITQHFSENSKNETITGPPSKSIQRKEHHLSIPSPEKTQNMNNTEKQSPEVIETQSPEVIETHSPEVVNANAPTHPPSVHLETPLVRDEETNFYQPNHSAQPAGNNRRSLRQRGLPPEYLGVDRKDRPLLNPTI